LTPWGAVARCELGDEWAAPGRGKTFECVGCQRF
jgi:hypothetical protein